jgi:uncharacterized protein (TIGR01244 family)
MRLIHATVLALLLAVPAAGQVQRGEIDGVTNFSRVDATVGCAGATSPSAMAGLKREGFVSVVNLRLASEPGAEVEESRAAAETAGLKYIHLPFSPAAPDAEIVKQFLGVVADPANQPVFIHCGSANRVGAVWMIKRARQDGWSLERARAEAEAIGLTSPQLATFATEYIQSNR